MSENETTETNQNNSFLEELEELVEDENVTTSKRKLPVLPQLGIASFVLLSVFTVGFGPKIFDSFKVNTEITESKNTNSTPQAGVDNPFLSINIEAKAAIVLDAKTGEVLYEKNSDTELPLASVTKLMTALVANEILNNEGNIKIDQNDIAQAGDSGLSDGETFSVKKLNDLTLLVSSNDGAFALAAAAGAFLNSSEPAAAFVKAMNIKAKELGLTKTYYRNPTGLDLTSTEAGAYGSASDMAYLMKHIISTVPEILEETTTDKTVIYNQAGVYHEAENTNPIVNSIPGLIGSKTGYTELAGGNLVVAFNVGLDHPVVVAVLGSSHSGRFNDVLKLVKATNGALEVNL